MTFFEHQHRARRNTRIMVVLYALAVMGVVLAVDLVIAAAYIAWVSDFAKAVVRYQGVIPMFFAVPAKVYAWGALGTVTLILGASLVQMSNLRDGGAAVAGMMGARRVASSTRDRLERRLLNVVEEMAIAAGTRIPAVFVMDGEAGINAFAAGYDISDTVVAVTRGTLETLNRDELQGVIGHEFSHIVNGDMSLNIRMIGVLAGIVFIGAIGGFILRSVRGGDSRSGGGAVFVVGLALFIIGYVGLFFARLIKASVSREREFLADASSVQFTRNPDGIAGALDQIRASARGTLVVNRYAEDVSHMFFGQGISVWLGGLFDTHPPVEERIRRVHPRFQASGYRRQRPVPEASPEPEGEPANAAIAGFASGAAAGTAPHGAGARGGDISYSWGRSASESAELVGTLTADNVDFAQRLLAALPAGLHDRLHQPESAGAAVIALLLAPVASVMEAQLAALRAAGVARFADAARAQVSDIQALGMAFHLPVVDLALPALKSAPAEFQAEFLKALEAVIYADRRVSLHEFVVLTLVRAQFSPRSRYAAPKFKSIAEARVEAHLLLSLVAYAGCRRGADDARELNAAFRAGATEMGLADASPVNREAMKLEAAAAALEMLRDLAPLPKAVLLKGLFAAATADGTIRVVEAELLRMAGAVLDCPLPPLLDQLDPAQLAD